MAWRETWLQSDLSSPINVELLTGVMFSQDSMANKIGVEVFNEGEPALLDGSIAGYVILDDGQTVEITPSSGMTGKEDNFAWVILPELAYSVIGRISIVIKLITPRSATTLCACTGYVVRSRTSNGVIPSGQPVPSLADLEMAIATAFNAANLANSAATRIENLKPYVEVQQISGDYYRLILDSDTLSPGSNKSRKVILVSDSYGEGYVFGQAEYNTAWPRLVQSHLNASDIAFYFAVHGGCSFSDDNRRFNFQYIFDEDSEGVWSYEDHAYHPFSLPSDVSANDITDVYLFAGRNDFSRDPTKIQNGMQGFIAKCRSLFPNAVVSIGMIGGISKDGHQNDGTGDVYQSYNEKQRRETADLYSNCTFYGARYIGNCESILKDTAYMAVDGIHPNQNGQIILGKYLANAILGSGVSVDRFRTYDLIFPSGSSFSFGSGVFPYMDQTQDDQKVNLFSRTSLNIQSSVDLNISRGDRIALFMPSDTCFVGDAYVRPNISLMISFIDKNGNAYLSRNDIELRDGCFYLICELLQTDGTYRQNDPVDGYALKDIRAILIPRIFMSA